jgi:uncharacterized RDD family membrane protein YckC
MHPIKLPEPAPDNNGLALTAKETREIVTPYAFHVDPELLGVPLASPLRRGVAMAIDGLIVLGLAKASLMVMVPVLAYLMWLRVKAQKYVQVFLLLLVGFVAVGSAEYAPEILFDAPETAASGKELNVETSVQIGLSGVAISNESCHDGCVAKELKSVRRMMQKNLIDRAMATDVMTGLLEGSQLSQERRTQMLEEVLKHYPMSEAQVAAVSDVKQQLPVTEAWYIPDPETKSIMEWVKGVLQDLGIGFGWAVFYFTALVGWTNGQTIGKKLCQIRIVRLGGGSLDLWQAFSRQGGYGAGFATGLLGFLQIFWDPNRQAIQDKGSGTVVIRLNKPKQPLHH